MIARERVTEKQDHLLGALHEEMNALCGHRLFRTEMLKAVYRNHLSFGKRLESSLGYSADDNPLASSHAFYRNGVQVAGMYNYMSGPSRIELKDEHCLFRRKNRVVFLTQYYMLERDGQTLATAKESVRIFGSGSKISFTNKPPVRDFMVKGNFRKLLGREYLVLNGKELVGSVAYNTDLGADIELPSRIPLAIQVFIFRVAYNMWQRGGTR